MANWEKEDLLCSDLPTTPCPSVGRILVSGASGYIGGRLIRELLVRGYQVRAMVRADPQRYEGRWPNTEIVAADALDCESLRSALTGVDTAYYLIHSLMLGQERFVEADYQAASNFRLLAEETGVRRIIYLGGLGEESANLSNHLKSRMEVAWELQIGRVPVTILRAAIIIGSGSASYEIVSHLVKNLRFLPMPRWAQTRCQPIGIRDVVKYLVGVLETPETSGHVYDIGGPDILTYEQILQVKAKVLGKRIVTFHTPFYHTGLFAYLASLAIPVPAPIVHSLMEGLRNEVVCRNDAIREVLNFPLLPFKETLVRALTREEQDKIHTRWSDAYPPAHELALKLEELPTKPAFIATYFLLSEKSSEALFTSACQIGGKRGWFQSNWLWRIRGMIDRLMMGIGTARGRRSDNSLRKDDVIDFWRVEEIRPHELLRLRAEMILPGKAWLEFCIQPEPEKGLRRLTVNAYFATDTRLGRLYWYSVYPFHAFVFKDLIKGIEKRSVKE